MERQETLSSSEQEQQERLAKALQSFPDKITEDQLDWLEGYRLYEALRNLPPNVLNVSGRFLYSDISTLKPGKIYLLGYNPGGKPDEHPSLRNEIRQWFSKNDNAYLDEEWRGFQKGQAPLQQRVKALLNAIGIKPEDVCASNLFFVRSEREEEMSKIIKDILNKSPEGSFNCHFQSVHKAMIDIVKPGCIIAFGLTTYRIIKKLFHSTCESTFPSHYKHRGKDLDYKIAERIQIKIIGLPHLSHYDPRNYHDVLQKIKEECQTASTKS